MQHARDLEGGGGSQETEKTHNRHTSLRDGRPNPETDADEHRPRKILDEVRHDRPYLQSLTEPRAEQEQHALHSEAEPDRQPSHPEEFDPEVGGRSRSLLG